MYWKLVEIRRRGCKSLEMTGYVSLSLSQWLRWGARAKAESRGECGSYPAGSAGLDGWEEHLVSLVAITTSSSTLYACIPTVKCFPLDASYHATHPVSGFTTRSTADPGLKQTDLPPCRRSTRFCSGVSNPPVSTPHPSAPLAAHVSPTHPAPHGSPRRDTTSPRCRGRRRVFAPWRRQHRLVSCRACWASRCLHMGKRRRWFPSTLISRVGRMPRRPRGN